MLTAAAGGKFCPDLLQMGTQGSESWSLTGSRWQSQLSAYTFCTSSAVPSTPSQLFKNKLINIEIEPCMRSRNFLLKCEDSAILQHTWLSYIFHSAAECPDPFYVVFRIQSDSNNLFSTCKWLPVIIVGQTIQLVFFLQLY